MACKNSNGKDQIIKKKINIFSSYKISIIYLFTFLFLQNVLVFSQPVIKDGEKVPIDGGGFAYIIADIKESRSILDLLPINDLKTWQSIYVLDNTRMGIVALFGKETGRRFQLIGWGKYPKFGMSIALFFHKNWKRIVTKSGIYWSSIVDRTSISLGTKQVHAAAWLKNPGNPIPAQNVEIPEGFTFFRGNSPFSCWIDRPGRFINPMLKEEGFPINIQAQRLFLCVFPTEDKKYTLLLKFQFSTAAQARAIGVILNLAKVGNTLFDGKNSVLTSIFIKSSPTVNAKDIDICTDPLSENDLSLLLQTFLVYWQ